MYTATKGIPAVFTSHERLPLTSFLPLTILSPSRRRDQRLSALYTGNARSNYPWKTDVFQRSVHILRRNSSSTLSILIASVNMNLKNTYMVRLLQKMVFI